MTQQTTRCKAESVTVLDVREELANGGEPFVRIMEAAGAVQPGGILVVIAPFEPLPLYEVLGALGFTHQTAMVTPDTWAVRFAAAK
ncbi:hypothetical protein KDH_73950 [Dictyobacter sp. S3.2.2.5]|uniref:DUF2249 domain-containing protein n=1 Tax=Dictyobacter halimunensis TaxID=3026934 RepID=A0ABQ6G6Y2_9CHLR|nr:hypothetical protein KDH_73950 [Dictyobacter sp. S3.2.2.5]